MVVSLLFVPSVTFAKNDNGNNGKEKKNQVQATVQANGCPTKAFGHLFASGWLKGNTAASVPVGCYLPAGIAKKLGLRTPITASTTDTLAPTLSSIVATPGTTTATVTWNTNEAADSAIFFGTSLPVNTSATATQVVASNLRITTHSLQMTNLSTSTTYFVVVRSRDAAGNPTMSAPVSFTTGTSADVTAPVMTNLITVVGTSTLKFTWNTSEAATSKVFYSTVSPVNVNSTSTTFVENPAFVTAHSVTLTGLSTSTLYRIVVQSKDAALNVSSGIEFPVTTSQ